MNDKGNLFRVIKQLVNRNRDIVGANCVKDSDGKIVVEEDRLMEVWRAHYDVLSKEEFTWDRKGLTDVSPVCGQSSLRRIIRKIYKIRGLASKSLLLASPFEVLLNESKHKFKAFYCKSNYSEYYYLN